MTVPKRTTSVMRGAVSALIATAILLGGFGGFSLWQDSLQGSINDAISTGRLQILEVEEGVWSFAANDTDFTGDGPDNTEYDIDLGEFKVSPGDELIYRTWVTVYLCGDDMLGEFSVDQDSYSVNDPALEGLVIVSVDNANLTVYPKPEPQRVPIKLTVKFSELIPGSKGQDLANAVDLSQITVRLNQVQAPAQAPALTSSP